MSDKDAMHPADWDDCLKQGMVFHPFLFSSRMRQWEQKKFIERKKKRLFFF